MLNDVFIRTGLEGVGPLDDFGLRLSVHDTSQRTLHLKPESVEGRLLLFDDEPKRVVVIGTQQFTLAGSASSLLSFCHMIDETVATMMAYGFPIPGQIGKPSP